MKYIIIKSTDGMGSNIANLIDAMYLSEKTNRQLYINWNDKTYSDGYTNIYPVLFKYPSNDEINFDTTYFPNLWNKNNIHQPVKHLIKNIDKNDLYFIYETATTKDEDIIVIVNRLRINVNKSKFYKQLQPSDEIIEEINNFYNKYMKGIIIGVHYRHGNGELKNKRRVHLYHEYFSYIDNFDYDVNIFVCTDNKRILNDFKFRYSTRIIDREKWYPIEDVGGPMHGSGNCPNKLQNAKDAIIDMYLLSKCTYLIYPRGSWFSTFSINVSETIKETKIVDVIDGI